MLLLWLLWLLRAGSLEWLAPPPPLPPGRHVAPDSPAVAIYGPDRPNNGACTAIRDCNKCLQTAMSPCYGTAMRACRLVVLSPTATAATVNSGCCREQPLLTTAATAVDSSHCSQQQPLFTTAAAAHDSSHYSQQQRLLSTAATAHESVAALATRRQAPPAVCWS